MNWKCFFAMLARDAHVARRNFFVLLLQTFLQPLMFVFIFGRVMVRSGYMPEAYKSLLLPGIMAISMVFTGVWAVAMPLIAEFQFTRRSKIACWPRWKSRGLQSRRCSPARSRHCSQDSS